MRCTRSRRHIISAVLLIAMCMGRICLARLVNYEDDPDLKAAMQYDSEYNGGDRDLASQSLAEQHYLRYLQRCREPSQRAKVYVQLGVLFATNWHGDKGEQPDYEKSVEYMKKALEEEPERVGSETIRARCFLLTPLHTRQEAMELRCQNYEWLLGVQAALGGEAKPEILLPDVPGEPLAAHRIGALKSLAVNVVSSEGYNLASTADSFPDRFDRLRHLEDVIRRFPGTAAEEEARARLAAVRGKIQIELEANVGVPSLADFSLVDSEQPSLDSADPGAGGEEPAGGPGPSNPGLREERGNRALAAAVLGVASVMALVFIMWQVKRRRGMGGHAR